MRPDGWGIHREDPRETELRTRDTAPPYPAGWWYCEQCERVRTETCVACGDEEGLHAA